MSHIELLNHAAVCAALKQIFTVFQVNIATGFSNVSVKSRPKTFEEVNGLFSLVLSVFPPQSDNGQDSRKLWQNFKVDLLMAAQNSDSCFCSSAVSVDTNKINSFEAASFYKKMLFAIDQSKTFVHTSPKKNWMLRNIWKISLHMTREQSLADLNAFWKDATGQQMQCYEVNLTLSFNSHFND